MAGSIKLFRQFRDWEWYQDENVKSVFIELLLTANYKDLRWQGKVVKRGQLITSRAKLAAYLGKTEQNIRTALGKLQSTGEIELKATNKYTLITICKYDYWQSQNGYEQPTINQPTNQQVTNEQPTTNQQLTTSKESKEYKEREEINNTPPPPRACVGEEVFFAKLKQGFTVWQAQACKILGVDQATLAKYIDMFELECQGKEKKHDDLKDTKEHFIKWARYYMDFEKKRQKESNNETVRTIGINQRRGFEVTATSAEDYKKKVSSRNDTAAGV